MSRKLTLHEYLAERRQEGPGCWPWRRSCAKSGYGQGFWNGKVRTAHRMTYEAYYGPIPDGLHIMHTCDNRACVNPAHLRAGTNYDNILDRIQKGRSSHKPPKIGAQVNTAKLTDKQVLEIRALGPIQYGQLEQVAAQYGVKRQTITNIRGRRAWKHLEGGTEGVARVKAARKARPPRNKLVPEMVKEIRWLGSQKLFTSRETAAEFGVKPVTVRSILARNIWKHI